MITADASVVLTQSHMPGTYQSDTRETTETTGTISLCSDCRTGVTRRKLASERKSEITSTIPYASQNPGVRQRRGSDDSVGMHLDPGAPS